jgi:hypothetical protein
MSILNSLCAKHVFETVATAIKWVSSKSYQSMLGSTAFLVAVYMIDRLSPNGIHHPQTKERVIGPAGSGRPFGWAI